VTEAPTPATRWDRRRAQTHRRLLVVAELLFKTQGFEATTVEEIAAAADVAKGTFFNYFSSKEALLGELLYARIEPLLTDLPEGGGTAADRVWRLLTSVRLELAPYVGLLPRMFAYAFSHPHLQASAGAQGPDRVSLARAIAHLVRQGQRDGTFRPGCDAEIAGGLIATYFFRLSVVECGSEAEGDFCWEDQMRSALAMLYEGIASPPVTDNAF
jgi:TetR/AcrR family transcriptional regulator, regulator of autoinduction and epiphytic fitness